ncbi:MAG: hypothetical protein AAB538_04135, partial [Patescibacteria group bacterium]
GDPFTFKPPRTLGEYKLLGLGLGLYWGEGTKSNKHAIRLGNSDPALLNMFIRFLTKIFDVKKEDLRFGLQTFTDISSKQALDFWVKMLKVKRTQFQKPVVTISGSIGTYRQKSQYGVVTLYYHNKKARDLLMGMLADVAQWQSNSMVGRMPPPNLAGMPSMNPE